MMSKVCTQCDSKFGKLSSGHHTGKGQFSFQPQRNAIQTNVQTTAQLHTSHIEENSRMGKTRDLFKKIRDNKAQ